MTRRPLMVPALLAVALVLSACAATTEPPSSSTGKRTSASPSATPTTPEPTPSASDGQDPSDPATWIISSEGVGPARLGDTRDEVITALAPIGAPLSDGCPNSAITFLGPAGATPASGDDALIAAADSGVVAIALGRSGPTTREGIGVGSSLDRVVGAYPDAARTLRNQAVPQYVVQGDPGWITFQMSGDGANGKVDLVSVVKGSEPPAEYCG